MFKEIDLSAFPPERQNNLESIYRYNAFDLMLYRSNLWTHNQRVLWLIEECSDIIKKYTNCDIEKCRILALVHDDAEMITGDIPGHWKTAENKEELRNREMLAIEELSRKYPKEIHGYSYKELLVSAIDKDSMEAKVVSYFDKLDAYCECLHEVYAGNISLIRGIIFYADIMAIFPIKYPELKAMLSSKENPLVNTKEQISPEKIKVENFKHLNKPHTKESILLDTDYTFYKEWKRIIIKRGHIDWLIKK